MSWLRFTSACFILGLGLSAFAALSPKYADWAKGPEQWLMTAEDQVAWKHIQTDDEAKAFVDLFWARRDPSPGTALNEMHILFDKRVVTADKNFTTKKTRGALTDPGKVFILLGAPKYLHKDTQGLDQGLARGPRGYMDLGSGERVGASMQWDYAQPADLGLTGPVFFEESVTSHEFHVNTHAGNIVGALAKAVTDYVFNPELTAVPDWAKGDPR